MNLNKALKQKKKLIAQIAVAQQRLFQNNSVQEGTERDYDPKEQYNLWFSLTEELIKLKTKIHLANAPIYHLLFQLSELKAFTSKLRCLNTLNGVQRDRYGSAAPKIYTSIFSTVQKDTIISAFEKQIEDLQEQIEIFNATTKI